jgi:hypothetical protein
MTGKSLLEMLPSTPSVPSMCSDTTNVSSSPMDTTNVSSSPMDTTNSGLRSEGYASKSRGKDASDWQVVTAFALEDLHADSPFFASNPSRPLPSFDAKGKENLRPMRGELLSQTSLYFVPNLTFYCFPLSEIHLGQMLGVGEFGAVFEVTQITDDSQIQLKELMLEAMASRNTAEPCDDGYSPGEDPTEDGQVLSSSFDEVVDKRGTIRERCWKEGRARYAVKQLRNGLGKRRLLDAVVDLAAERDFLASISHPNIIRLRGTVGTPGHSGFMLLMDRLHMSMNQKLQEWKRDVRSTMGCFGMRVRDKEARDSLLCARVIAAYDVARALNFLHGHK